MERDITKFKIGEHTFEAKTYATARETHTIQKAYFAGAKVEIVGEAPKINDFDPSVQFNVQLEMITQIVVKMDDNTEDITTRCENLPDHEFQELSTALDEIIAKKNK